MCSTRWKDKIKTEDQISKIVKESKKKGLTTGLVTGCFDIIHSGHVDLFHFAREHVDILLVGLDRDESIMQSKGKGRPINPLSVRLKVLAELMSVDYVFPFKETFAHILRNANYYEDILRKIKPDYLITNPPADERMWKKKKELANKLGIGFLKDNRKKVNSTTRLIRKLKIL